MLDWLDGLAGPQYTRAILWTLAALVLLVVVLLVVRLIRGMTAGTYVAGGRSRKTRLSVMDATAVDSHRRLVLVRRDDVEHLLLIGGPTDVVVERDIRLVAARRPALTGEPAQQQRSTAHPAPAPATGRQAPAHSHAAHHHAGDREPASPSKPVSRYAPVAAPAAPRAAAQPLHDPIDDALMNELDFSLDDEPAAAKPAARPRSLDDEMTKLLGELSVHKR
jgi:hypothetical protein